jgi:hypothetical protein
MQMTNMDDVKDLDQDMLLEMEVLVPSVLQWCCRNLTVILLWC